MDFDASREHRQSILSIIDAISMLVDSIRFTWHFFNDRLICKKKDLDGSFSLSHFKYVYSSNVFQESLNK